MKQISIEGVEVKLSSTQLYKGRNGIGNCVKVGAGIGCTPNTTRLYPVNTKGTTGSCWFEMPDDDVPAVTLAIPNSASNLILDHLPRKTLTLLMGLHPALDEEIERRLKNDAPDENLQDKPM